MTHRRISVIGRKVCATTYFIDGLDVNGREFVTPHTLLMDKERACDTTWFTDGVRVNRKEGFQHHMLHRLVMRRWQRACDKSYFMDGLSINGKESL